MNVIGKDLFDEKSLTNIYFQSVRRLSWSKFNTITTIVVFLLLCTHLFMSPKNPDITAMVRTLAASGLSYASSILGFLIAGFTIFATLTKPSLFVMMYHKTHRGSKLNYLKYNFFAFIEVFIIYLIFLTICVLVGIFGTPHGAVITLLEFFSNKFSLNINELKIWLIYFSYVTIGTLFYYTIVILKSFLFNIYHITITSIVWELNANSK